MPIDFTTVFLIAFLCLMLGVSLVLLLYFAPMLLAFVRFGAPFVPTNKEVLAQMIALATLGPEDKVVDLGSGDGRIVLSALAAGARKGTGYELSPGLVWHSRIKARLAGVSDRADFRCKDMWGADLSDADVIFLYQLPFSMNRFHKRFAGKLKPGARVISHAFRITGVQEEAKNGEAILYRM